jgi:hypothetical protein
VQTSVLAKGRPYIHREDGIGRACMHVLLLQLGIDAGRGRQYCLVGRRCGVAQRNKVGVFTLSGHKFQRIATIIELTILDNFQLEHA